MARKSAQPTMTHGRIQVRNTIAWSLFEGSERSRKHKSYIQRKLANVRKDGTDILAEAQISGQVFEVALLAGQEKWVPTDIIGTLVAA